MRLMHDPSHKAAFVVTSPAYQEQRGHHVMPGPLGCGAVYDGGGEHELRDNLTRMWRSWLQAERDVEPLVCNDIHMHTAHGP
jgi:hypothetical protein